MYILMTQHWLCPVTVSYVTISYMLGTLMNKQFIYEVIVLLSFTVDMLYLEQVHVFLFINLSHCIVGGLSGNAHIFHFFLKKNFPKSQLIIIYIQRQEHLNANINHIYNYIYIYIYIYIYVYRVIYSNVYSHPLAYLACH